MNEKAILEKQLNDRDLVVSQANQGIIEEKGALEKQLKDLEGHIQLNKIEKENYIIKIDE